MVKKKKFLQDVIFNVMAFGLYIFAFHVVMLPFMAKILPSEINAKLLAFITLNNISTIALGNELGILYQVLIGRENTPDHILNDTKHLLLRSSLVLFLVQSFILILMKFPIQHVLVLGLVSLLSNARLYFQGVLRQEKKFISTGISNFMYLIGVVLSILIIHFTRLRTYYFPMLIAETLSILSILWMYEGFRKKIYTVSQKFSNYRIEFINLAGATLLNNIPTYADKLLVLPLLGSRNMSVYFAGTALSKVLFLLVNPINSVLLSWLSSDHDSNPKTVIKRQIGINILTLVFVFIFAFPITYLATYILYRQFLSEVMTILIPLCFIAGFQIATSTLKIIFLRYFDLKQIKYINIIHVTVFLIASPLGARWGGLVGYAYGVAFSKIVLWLIYFFAIMRYLKNMNEACEH